MQGGGDITLKMLLVGNAGVGKTSHIMRFTDCIFTGGYSATMGVDFKKDHEGDRWEKCRVSNLGYCWAGKV